MTPLPSECPEPADEALDSALLGARRARIVRPGAGAGRDPTRRSFDVDAPCELGGAPARGSSRRARGRYLLRHSGRADLPDLRGHPTHARRAPRRVAARDARRLRGRAVPASQRAGAGRGRDRWARDHQRSDRDRVGEPRADSHARHRGRRRVGDHRGSSGPRFGSRGALGGGDAGIDHARAGPGGALAQRRGSGARRARPGVQSRTSRAGAVRAAPRPCHGRVRRHRAACAHRAMVRGAPARVRARHRREAPGGATPPHRARRRLPRPRGCRAGAGRRLPDPVRDHPPGERHR